MTTSCSAPRPSPNVSVVTGPADTGGEIRGPTLKGEARGPFHRDTGSGAPLQKCNSSAEVSMVVVVGKFGTHFPFSFRHTEHCTNCTSRSGMHNI